MFKFATTVKLLAASTIGFGILFSASAASATSFVPQMEGEIKLEGLGCRSNAASVTNCIDTTSLGYTVKGIGGSKSSLLFVDDSATHNSYSLGAFSIIFPGLNGTPSSDAQPGGLLGTAVDPGAFWFRPVDIDNNGKPIEGGQREVGQFKFTFTNKVDKIKLRFFDVERQGTSHNGTPVTPGGNGNIREVTLTNVTKLRLNLGNGQDGVLAQAYKVPEPGSIFGLGMLVIGGAFAAKGRKKSTAS